MDASSWGLIFSPVIGPHAALQLLPPLMDEMDDILHRMRVTNLEARRELCEIERIALDREITYPTTSADRRAEAINRRDEVLGEWAEIVSELRVLSGSRQITH
jgi:hypothetical protein